MTVEAEIEVMQPQAKECQQPPGAGRGKEWILSLKPYCGPADTLISPTETNFELLVCRTAREYVLLF